MDITSSNNTFIGGIAGEFSAGDITDCHNRGENLKAIITIITGTSKVGGIAGNTGASLAQTAAITNLSRHDVSGSEELSVTRRSTVLSEESSAANRTSGSVAQDEVSGDSGGLTAAETRGRASASDADALSSAATGVRNTSGGLKTNQTLEDIS